MPILHTLLMCFAFVFLALAAFKTPEHPRLAFGWAGLTLWALVILLGTAGQAFR